MAAMIAGIGPLPKTSCGCRNMEAEEKQEAAEKEVEAKRRSWRRSIEAREKK